MFLIFDGELHTVRNTLSVYIHIYYIPFIATPKLNDIFFAVGYKKSRLRIPALSPLSAYLANRLKVPCTTYKKLIPT